LLIDDHAMHVMIIDNQRNRVVDTLLEHDKIGSDLQQRGSADQQDEKVNSTSVPVFDPRYRNLTCYNCGEPGYFVAICTKPKVCLVYTIPDHYMYDCPFWKNE
jgi:hypothetical protein